MRGWMGMQAQHPAAEVDAGLVLHQQRRLGVVAGRLQAEQVGESVAVELAPFH